MKGLLLIGIAVMRYDCILAIARPDQFTVAVAAPCPAARAAPVEKRARRHFADRQQPSSAAVRLRERADFVARHLQNSLGERGIAYDACELGRWSVKAAIVTDHEVLSTLLDECPVTVLDRRAFEHAVTHGRLSEASDER